jgi:pyrroloquinoline quinone biosynthesis protein B
MTPLLIALLSWISLSPNVPHNEGPYIKILGIAQDAGYPQADCSKECCEKAWKNPGLKRHAASIGIVDPSSSSAWMIEATPDFKDQWQVLKREGKESNTHLKGIFLTHAHIGHYAGLIHLGNEVMGASAVPVFAMPRMKIFLENNGPWDLLVQLQNIDIHPISEKEPIKLTPELEIEAIEVPHRDEYSETVGYVIRGKKKSVLFIPDIDKWHLWDEDLADWITKVDVALVDGTFFADGELPGRDMNLIKHPFVAETMDLLENHPEDFRNKLYFIHLNHTNPLLDSNSPEYRKTFQKGFRIAEEGMIISL